MEPLRPFVSRPMLQLVKSPGYMGKKEEEPTEEEEDRPNSLPAARHPKRPLSDFFSFLTFGFQIPLFSSFR